MAAQIVERIPLFGRIIGASNRAYAAFLNKARWDTYVKHRVLLGDDATEAQLRT